MFSWNSNILCKFARKTKKIEFLWQWVRKFICSGYWNLLKIDSGNTFSWWKVLCNNLCTCFNTHCDVHTLMNLLNLNTENTFEMFFRLLIVQLVMVNCVTFSITIYLPVSLPIVSNAIMSQICRIFTLILWVNIFSTLFHNANRLYTYTCSYFWHSSFLSSTFTAFDVFEVQ